MTKGAYILSEEQTLDQIRGYLDEGRTCDEIIKLMPDVRDWAIRRYVDNIRADRIRELKKQFDGIREILNDPNLDPSPEDFRRREKFQLLDEKKATDLDG